MRYRLPAYKAGGWLTFLLAQGYLVQEGEHLRVTDPAYDASVAAEIISAFR